MFGHARDLIQRLLRRQSWGLLNPVTLEAAKSHLLVAHIGLGAEVAQELLVGLQKFKHMHLAGIRP